MRPLASEIDSLESQIFAWQRADDTSRRIATIPGIGPITASAIAAAVLQASLFRSGRQFSACLRLTTTPMAQAAKSGSAGLASRATILSQAAVRRRDGGYADGSDDASRHPWLARLLERKPAKIAIVGLANKTARITWAVMARNEVYAAAAVGPLSSSPAETGDGWCKSS
ncbi:transposase [Sphingomonas sp. BIUV-7]|uniref:Transposase n=1 Tax=Sphingomonas natans TaxID=3063330 RepID=A0ABT8YES9_9SPHN|nr:transposase [Sphingomonas sp. BIUV-7]MDO6416085.1 transposase [Sphingomonas sp. BIUV-7]